MSFECILALLKAAPIEALILFVVSNVKIDAIDEEI